MCGRDEHNEGGGGARRAAREVDGRIARTSDHTWRAGYTARRAHGPLLADLEGLCASDTVLAWRICLPAEEGCPWRRRPQAVNMHLSGGALLIQRHECGSERRACRPCYLSKS